MKNRILISAAGTAAAFHLADLARNRFSDALELHLCDTNPKHLVPAAVFSERFFKVLPVAAPNFRDSLLKLFSDSKIEIYLPLVDADVYAFPCDDPALRDLGVMSAAPPSQAAAILRNKAALSAWLQSRGFSVPRCFTAEEVRLGDPTMSYFVKPVDGFGSRGASSMTGHQLVGALKNREGENWIIQEQCTGPELTVEVFNSKDVVKALCRERLEVKSGVCTKARLWLDPGFTSLAERLCKTISLPVAFCFQVMRSGSGEWALTDLNPRLGAGSALASTCGWSLAAAALSTWAGLDRNPLEFLEQFKGDRFAVRAYREFRTL